ncbi:uncharacterized protein si:ch1073-126c3.2 [Polypterus senegalus]|uniref:uncharacterized protein si:ch1073-126c3.2 n=1 Tax=Polypterus senegalus TaxID=55291 RepID=UPI0019665F8D|nr:uncharacterized protein si:ch1073-126c3.2 [Polypterus senegalus]
MLTWQISGGLLLYFFFRSNALIGFSLPDNCLPSSKDPQMVSEQLKNLTECTKEEIDTWDRRNVALVLSSAKRLMDLLEKKQRTACNDIIPAQCEVPIPPSAGGLVCVTISNIRYCKPMCNRGYDFDFIRRSRIYEQCGEQTEYKWTTQYIGGQKLAFCSKSSISVAGAPSAYFTENEECQQVLQNQDLQKSIINDFLKELKENGINGNHEMGYDCLICGSFPV